MHRLFILTFIATVIVSLGGWFWLLGGFLRWLIVKL
jgi:hypothetical protein